jgi:hypothetical protein
MMSLKGRYSAYLLRIWQIKDSGKWVWRVSLEDSQTGERLGFPDINDLLAFLQEEFKKTPLDENNELENLNR